MWWHSLVLYVCDPSYERCLHRWRCFSSSSRDRENSYLSYFSSSFLPSPSSLLFLPSFLPSSFFRFLTDVRYIPQKAKRPKKTWRRKRTKKERFLWLLTLIEWTRHKMQPIKTKNTKTKTSSGHQQQQHDAEEELKKEEVVEEEEKKTLLQSSSKIPPHTSHHHTQHQHRPPHTFYE